MMALIEKILEEIKLLNRKEKEILLDVLKREKAKNVDAEKFEQAAGSWADFDAEDFIADIYTRRYTGERVVPEW
jgi:fructose-1,6-bisphosphatase/inositol monophosphatase family enzyme